MSAPYYLFSDKFFKLHDVIVNKHTNTPLEIRIASPAFPELRNVMDQSQKKKRKKIENFFPKNVVIR